MFSQYPKPYRIALRTTLATSWGFLAFSGFAGAFIPGRTVLEAVSSNWVIHTSGYMTMIASLIAFLGVVIARKFWWLEWIGAGLTGAGLIHYVSVPWTFLVHGEWGRLQQATVVTAALFGFVIFRLISCAAHAQKLRLQNELDTALLRQINNE